MEHGWIGSAPGGTAADRAERAPSVVVSAAHSAFGAVRRLQVRLGEVAVVLHPAPPAPSAPGTVPVGAAAATRPPAGQPAGRAGADDGWVRAQVSADLDVAAHLITQLDLAGREDEGAPAQRWSGTVAIGRYASLRRADPADAAALAVATGCPVELVRALADPVALSRVEVLRRDGAARGTGPGTVGTDELAWVDGGPSGLWTVRPEDADAVRIARGTPAEVAAELAGMVRAAEGC